MCEERLGILCSGRGSNLASIMDAVACGAIKAEISVVIADKADAYALVRAQEAGISVTTRNGRTLSRPCLMYSTHIM